MLPARIPLAWILGIYGAGAVVVGSVERAKWLKRALKKGRHDVLAVAPAACKAVLIASSCGYTLFFQDSELFLARGKQLVQA